jgi:hypothetical protein
VEVVGHLGARLILQQALEDEVTEFLGRDSHPITGAFCQHSLNIGRGVWSRQALIEREGGVTEPASTIRCASQA